MSRRGVGLPVKQIQGAFNTNKGAGGDVALPALVRSPNLQSKPGADRSGDVLSATVLLSTHDPRRNGSGQPRLFSLGEQNGKELGTVSNERP